jgi:colanic acid biosynthesis glycosyl transferase WcaI
LKRDPLFSITIPSKTQAYMATGRPILMGVDGDAADLVRQAGCGLALRSEDPEALAQAVRTLAALPPAELAAMGRRGQDHYHQHLALKVGASRFASVFRDLAARGRPAARPGPKP